MDVTFLFKYNNIPNVFKWRQCIRIIFPYRCAFSIKKKCVLLSVCCKWKIFLEVDQIN